MHQDTKKKQAAICGVLAYLQLHSDDQTEWARSSKEIAMQQRQMVQPKPFNRREL